MKAGHKRACERLSLALLRHVCPNCVVKVRNPFIDADGIHCPHCATIDQRKDVVITQIPTRSGFRWVASLEEKD